MKVILRGIAFNSNQNNNGLSGKRSSKTVKGDIDKRQLLN